MITSRQHPEVKELLKLSQRKHRLRQGQFLAEG
ncbi:MAG TPA: RNA methyltransferase, partial [Firmicutes bacterium]|nr:RNA methyltransferase [Bacillota bacterium]